MALSPANPTLQVQLEWFFVSLKPCHQQYPSFWNLRLVVVVVVCWSFPFFVDRLEMMAVSFLISAICDSMIVIWVLLDLTIVSNVSFRCTAALARLSNALTILSPISSSCAWLAIPLKDEPVSLMSSRFS